MDFMKKVAALVLLCCFNWICLVLSEKVSGNQVINIAHRPSTWAPLMHLSANLSDITSITSHFEFRTYDPEGIIFYGDTKDGQDWFVLSLRDGIPEVQIGKANILISVMGGPKINDGAWHKLELRSEGKYVIVEVNNKVELVVGMHSDQTEDVLLGVIRLALGGMLVDQNRLLHPFKPEMDACIREGHWLNLSTLWETNWELSPCISEIKKGIYFPGTGLALFNTSDLPGMETEEKGVTIEVNGSWHGTLLSLKSHGFKYMLPGTEGLEANKDLTMELKKGSGSSNTALPLKPTKLTFTILKHSLMINNKPVLENENMDFFSMWKEGMILAFGGAPEENQESKSLHHLHGCLEEILIQGKEINLDLAFLKHRSISSHSCPAKPMNELN
ncbi:sex hormone-binding globulin [Trichomycterus rosablanca]|uniref:sex hormone-binding globulin n=1 Tax=Trichomycterus rosablanca TaxID=2290929 RepID=UPI002F356EE6